MNAFLLIVLTVLSGEISDYKRYGKFGPVDVRLKCSEPTNIYLEDEFPTLYREPEIVAGFKYDGKEPVKITCNALLRDFYGNEQSVRPATVEVVLNPGEKKRISFTADPTRGAFTFQLGLKGEDGLKSLPEKHFEHIFIVSPNPVAGIYPDSFFRVEGSRVWRPYTGELCRRIGIKAAKIFVEPGTSQELFDGWAAAARLHDISLVPICPALSISNASAGNYANSSSNTHLPFFQNIRWGNACFRLTETDVDPEIIQKAGSHILHSYALEGRSYQIEYLLRNSKPQGLEKLSELGFLFFNQDGACPEAGPNFFRRLDRASCIARNYKKRISLCNYIPSGDIYQKASSLVSTYTMAALSGYFAVSSLGPQGIVERRGGRAFILSSVHSTLSYFLNGRVPVADVWPSENLLYGCVFASPKLRPGKIQRAEFLSVRDSVTRDNRVDDNLKIAVLFSPAKSIDKASEIFIPDSQDLAAYNLIGRPKGRRSGAGLSIPFGTEPVYVITRKLNVKDFVSKLHNSTIRGLNLFHFSLQPFTSLAIDLPAVRILMDNSDAKRFDGTFRIEGDGWKSEPASGLRFKINQGEVKEFTLPMKKSLRNSSGEYPFDVELDTPSGRKSFNVVIPTAMMWNVSARIDGVFNEWNSRPGLRIFKPSSSIYIQNPGKGNAVKKGANNPVAKLWMGHNDNLVFVAAKVSEKKIVTVWDGGTSRESISEALTGSYIQIAFGLGNRSSDSFHKGNDPLAWKGMIRDTDYLFLLAPINNGRSGLLCLHKTGMVWGECMLKGGFKVPGSEVVIRKKGNDTFYEASIPKSFLKGLKKEMKKLHIGVVINSQGKKYQLSESFGIPSYFASSGSFMPEEDGSLLPNCIWWGIER